MKLWETYTSYRNIPQETKDQLAEICQTSGIAKGELVAVFLAYSLQAYREGRLVLTPVARNTKGPDGSQ